MSHEVQKKENSSQNESKQLGGEGKGKSMVPPAFSLSAEPIQKMDAPIQRAEETRAERDRRTRPEREEGGSFGQPYSTWAEAMAAETYLRTVLLPASAGMFGAEVMSLWWSYLGREPGDDLTPHIYREGMSTIAYAFKRCSEIAGVQNRLLDRVQSNIGRVPSIAPNTWATVPISTFLGSDPLDLGDVNFSNPYNLPGHVAGGVSGSDAGPDSRWVSGNVKIFRMTDAAGVTTKLLVMPEFQFRIVDAIDFIPGGAGSGLEQALTIPLSRLEASGWAYDVPFEVLFSGPAQMRELSGSLYPAAPNPDEGTRRERQREPREPRDSPATRERLGEGNDSRRRDF